MLTLLKKLFSNKEKAPQVVSNNHELIEKLSELQYEEKLVDLFNRPENKLLLLNVYYSSFNDLLLNLINKTDDRQISSVNVYSYYKDTEDVNYSFKRIIPIVESNNINAKIVHDLNEIFDSVKFLKTLEDQS